MEGGGAKPGEMRVADLRGEAIRDPRGTRKPGTQHVTRLAAVMVAANVVMSQSFQAMLPAPSSLTGTGNYPLRIKSQSCGIVTFNVVQAGRGTTIFVHHKLAQSAQLA